MNLKAVAGLLMMGSTNWQISIQNRSDLADLSRYAIAPMGVLALPSRRLSKSCSRSNFFETKLKLGVGVPAEVDILGLAVKH